MMTALTHLLSAWIGAFSAVIVIALCTVSSREDKKAELFRDIPDEFNPAGIVKKEVNNHDH